MKARKVSAMFLAAVLVLGVVAGCGDSGTSGTDVPADSAAEETDAADDAGTDNTEGDTTKVVMKLSHGNPSSGMTGLAYDKFAEYVDELSGGTMEIEVYPSGTLVSDTECFDSVMEGTVDMTHDTVSRQSNTIPDVAPLEIPGYFLGDSTEWLDFAEAVREPLDAIYADYGIKYIAGNYQGTSCFVANDKQITSPDDLKGLSVRAMGTWISKAVQNWNGAPVSLALSDLPNGLERGTVDAAFTGWGVAIPNSLYEVSDYMTYTNLCEVYAVMLMNLDQWNSLTEEQQGVIQEAGRMFEEYSVTLADEMYEEGIQTATENGCSVYELTEEENAAFAALTDPLFEECAASMTEKGQALLDVIESFR